MGLFSDGNVGLQMPRARANANFFFPSVEIAQSVNSESFVANM